MALKKDVVLKNGVGIEYHRVVSLNIITNVVNVIEVCGYTSREKREEEIRVYESKVFKDIDIYLDTKYFDAPYDPNMTISSAYDYLKTLDEYKDAVDV